MIMPDKAVKLIEEADIIVLAGGPTLKQISSIHEYGLAPALREQQGITIGISVGSINMAKRRCISQRYVRRYPRTQHL